MLQTTEFTIIIAREELHHCTRYKLVQEIGEHHVLELYCRPHSYGRLEAGFFAESANLLGERVYFEARVGDASQTYGREPETLRFEGVVTGTDRYNDREHGGGIRITAHSPTVRLRGAPHARSFTDDTLSGIAHELLRGEEGRLLEAAVAPRYTESIPYAVQQEDRWDYLRGLAARYGEWFYYDGERLVFGEHPDYGRLDLNPSTGLKAHRVRVRPVPDQELLLASDYGAATVHEAFTTDAPAPALDGDAAAAREAARRLYPTTSVSPRSAAAHGAEREAVHAGTRLATAAAAAASVEVRGRSVNLGLHPGRLVRIEADDRDEGAFRITRVVHRGEYSGNYRNKFRGVSAAVEASPLTDVHRYPKAVSSTAIVEDNEDPEGLGRLRVRFPWQRHQSGCSPWIRVSAAYAGADKGVYFIPEVGEEVMVGFDDGNAERPYVTGGVYNGKQGASGIASGRNDVKMIRSRSGNSVELDDTPGKERLRMYDAAGNLIELDPKAQTLLVQAVEGLNLVGKNVRIQAEEQIELVAGTDVVARAEGEVDVGAGGDVAIVAEGANTLQSDGDTSVVSKSDLTVRAKAAATLAGQDVSVEGEASAEVKAQDTTVTGVMTVVQGATGKTQL